MFTTLVERLWSKIPEHMSYEDKAAFIVWYLKEQGLSVYEIQAIAWGMLEQTDVVMRYLKHSETMESKNDV